MSPRLLLSSSNIWLSSRQNIHQEPRLPAYNAGLIPTPEPDSLSRGRNDGVTSTSVGLNTTDAVGFFFMGSFLGLVTFIVTYFMLRLYLEHRRLWHAERVRRQIETGGRGFDRRGNRHRRVISRTGIQQAIDLDTLARRRQADNANQHEATLGRAQQGQDSISLSSTSLALATDYVKPPRSKNLECIVDLKVLYRLQEHVVQISIHIDRKGAFLRMQDWSVGRAYECIGPQRPLREPVSKNKERSEASKATNP